jgi:hypothetical protein
MRMLLILCTVVCLSACGGETIEFMEPCTNETVRGKYIGDIAVGRDAKCTGVIYESRLYCLESFPPNRSVGWECPEDKNAP